MLELIYMNKKNKQYMLELVDQKFFVNLSIKRTNYVHAQYLHMYINRWVVNSLHDALFKYIYVKTHF